MMPMRIIDLAAMGRSRTLRGMRKRVHGLGALVLVAFFLPTSADAQMEDEQHLRISAHLALGFAGEGDLDVHSDAGSIEGDGDLDPSIGFGLRAEHPIFDFLSVGGMFEALSFLIDVPEAEREWAFDFDVFVRVRYLFEVVRGEVFLEPYALLPIGFTFAWLDDPGALERGDEAWPGWNTGALAGIAVITSSRFVGFLELGWRHLELYNQDQPAGIDLGLAITTNELALNVGASLILE